jgi:hypothetical protein
VRDRALFVDESVDMRMILSWIFTNLNADMHWIFLAQNRNRWLAVLIVVIRIHVPENAGKYFTSLKKTGELQEEICCME